MNEHPFATYALGVIRLSGSVEHVLDPVSGLDVEVETDADTLKYYIDVDNLDTVLGAARVTEDANDDTDADEEFHRPLFDFQKWIKKHLRSKKTQRKRALLKVCWPKCSHSD